ncbi:DUF6266 family protein [Plebeiibacterium sediminum]|uniref:DUF6266 family protein n=1 Tax=Plebeiibacterium sediminum TaxID=2992112 RepID=A0AAE3MA63_9BACT|nr:DUF6266 family protein [Plebeiobacterium sediminum]MCW3789654.1 DUF6266 family protein [Plebeiobacterium sediminum]
MAKIKGNHLFGLISGRLGNTIGVIINGKQYFRQAPSKSSVKPSQKQIMQRARFAFAMKFLKPLRPVIQLGFYKRNDSRSAHNKAMSLLLQQTIKGEYPDYTINFQKLYLSKGPIERCDATSVEISDQNIIFQWKDAEEIINDHKREHALLIAITEHYEVVQSVDEYMRIDKTGKLSLPQAPSGTKIHCYLAFVDTKRSNRASNSEYLGFVSMP